MLKIITGRYGRAEGAKRILHSILHREGVEGQPILEPLRMCYGGTIFGRNKKRYVIIGGP